MIRDWVKLYIKDVMCFLVLLYNLKYIYISYLEWIFISYVDALKLQNYKITKLQNYYDLDDVYHMTIYPHR